MKLRIVKWKNVINHCRSDKKMLKAFNRFYDIAVISDWKTPQEIIQTFGNSDLITCDKQNTTRLVFNIGSNKYRMISGYYFAPNQVYLYIKFVGTHKQYDKIDVCLIDMFKS